jgi:outer membrane protein assembly factor BamD
MWGWVLVLVASGCAGRKERSDLLDLLGTTPEEVRASNQDIDNTYDALTLLSWAEAAYVSEDWIVAAADYRRFLALHPQHRMAAFAQYRLALSLEHQVNSADRDPGPVQEALLEFGKILSDFPQSLYVDAARSRISILTEKKAEHQYQVALFYYKKKAYPAAVARFEVALGLTQDEPLAPKALYYLAQAHHHLGQDEAAREALSRLTRQYPDSVYVAKSARLLPSP